MTHASVPKDQREVLGISDTLVSLITAFNLFLAELLQFTVD